MPYTTSQYALAPALVTAALFQSRFEPKRALGKRTTGWHSEYRYTVESAGVFKPVLTYILGQHPQLMLDRWWINVCGPNEQTFEHYHGHNMTSVVYYIQTPPNSGMIEFQRADNSWIGYQPSPGDIVAFDGMCLHRVQANLSEDIRISLALNLVTHQEFDRTKSSRINAVRT